MEEFASRFPFGIELDIDSHRVGHEKLQELLGPVTPVFQSDTKRLGGENERWVIKPCHRAGLKICSPVLPPTAESLQHLYSVLALLDFTGLSDQWNTPITRSCEYHLHLDVSELTVKEIAWGCTAARLAEAAILRAQPPSRAKAEHIRLLKYHLPDETLGKIAILQWLNKPGLAVNTFSLFIRGDLHIKYAAGTTNYIKIVNWLVLWSSILDRVLLNGPPSEPMADMESLCNWLLWPDDPESDMEMGQVRQFWLAREHDFQERRRERIRRKYEG